jgi:hypothetical protein
LAPEAAADLRIVAELVAVLGLGIDASLRVRPAVATV